jgi:hypothetical protein
MSHGNIDVLVLSFMCTSLAETTQQVAVLQNVVPVQMYLFSCGMAFDCKNSVCLSGLLNMHHWQLLNSYFVHIFHK